MFRSLYMIVGGIVPTMPLSLLAPDIRVGALARRNPPSAHVSWCPRARCAVNSSSSSGQRVLYMSRALTCVTLAAWQRVQLLCLHDKDACSRMHNRCEHSGVQHHHLLQRSSATCRCFGVHILCYFEVCAMASLRCRPPILVKPVTYPFTCTHRPPHPFPACAQRRHAS